MGTSPKVDGCAPIHVFASSKSWIEGNATLQLQQVAGLPGVRAVAAMPDLHPGKYGPVGCAVLADRIHPQLVGSDIAAAWGCLSLISLRASCGPTNWPSGCTRLISRGAATPTASWLTPALPP